MSAISKQAIAFLLIAASAGSARAEEGSRPFRVGAILALSGDGSNIGEACKNGMTLAHQSLAPAMREKVEVIYEDDRLQPKNTVTALNKLTSVNGIDALVTISSGTSKAVAPIAEQRGLPMVAIASDPEVVEGRRHVFNLWVTPDEQAKLLLAELQKRGIRRIARISATHDGTLAMNSAFDAANGGKVSLVIDEQYPVETKDFRPFIGKVKQQQEKIDAVFVELFFGQTGLFAKQARELGLALPLFNIETFEDPNELKLSEGALVGHWYIQADDAKEAFTDQYRKAYPEAATYSAGNCYDAVRLIAGALEQDPSGSSVSEHLRTVRGFSGAMGVYSATGDNRFSLPATTKVVTEEGFKKLASS